MKRSNNLILVWEKKIAKLLFFPADFDQDEIGHELTKCFQNAHRFGFSEKRGLGIIVTGFVLFFRFFT